MIHERHPAGFLIAATPAAMDKFRKVHQAKYKGKMTSKNPFEKENQGNNAPAPMAPGNLTVPTERGHQSQTRESMNTHGPSRSGSDPQSLAKQGSATGRIMGNVQAGRVLSGGDKIPEQDLISGDTPCVGIAPVLEGPRDESGTDNNPEKTSNRAKYNRHKQKKDNENDNREPSEEGTESEEGEEVNDEAGINRWTLVKGQNKRQASPLENGNGTKRHDGKITPQQGQQRLKVNTEKELGEQVIQKRQFRPPPIFITTHKNFTTIARKLNIAAKQDPRLVYTKTGGKLMTETMDDHKACLQILKEMKTPHFTHRERQDKFTTVIRGIPPMITEEDITEMLEEKDIQIHNIRQLSRRDREGNMTIPMPLHVIEASNTQKEKLINLHNLAGIAVKTEPYRKQQKILQCYKCQDFGHHSACCEKEEICVKCAGQHHSNKCPRKSDSNIPLKCANCGEQHSAGSKDCPKRKELEWKKFGKGQTATSEKENEPKGHNIKRWEEEYPPLPQQEQREKGVETTRVDNRKEEQSSEQVETIKKEMKQVSEAISFMQSPEVREVIKMILKWKRKMGKGQNPAERKQILVEQIFKGLVSNDTQSQLLLEKEKPKKKRRKITKPKNKMQNMNKEQKPQGTTQEVFYFYPDETDENEEENDSEVEIEMVEGEENNQDIAKITDNTQDKESQKEEEADRQPRTQEEGGKMKLSRLING